MKKQEFKEKVLEPLEKEFNILIYFNGQDAKDESLQLRGAIGRSYYNRKNKPCVITWHRDLNETFQVTFHEIGHSALHGKGSGIKQGKTFKEIEAEMVAKRTCQLLNIIYRPGFRNEKETNYIDWHTKKYLHNCNVFGNEPREPREDKINEVAEKIYNVLKGVI